MKKKTMMIAAVAMTGLVIAMTGCAGMCGKKDCSSGTCSMKAAQHPAGCACEKCAAM